MQWKNSALQYSHIDSLALREVEWAQINRASPLEVYKPSCCLSSLHLEQFLHIKTKFYQAPIYQTFDSPLSHA